MIPSISNAAARRLRPQGPFHLSPGAQPLRSWVDLIIENSSMQPEAVLRDIHREISWQVAMTQDIVQPTTWTTRVMMPSVPTIIHYHFKFPDNTVLRESKQREGRNTPIYREWEQREFQIGVYDPVQMPPEWTHGIVVYQLFPDRFANGDTSTDRLSKGVYGQEPLYLNWSEAPEHPPRGRDFYGGDLRGLIERLDYLADLGIECIYLTPIFASPSNHRYDTLDYFRIDPMLGTEAEFTELVDKAHSKGLKIILDGVFNHCSSDSRYFNGAGHYGNDTGAAQNQQSPYYRWFEFKKWPNEYDGWMGLNHMPEFVECPEVEDFFIGPQGVGVHWLQRGIDGWRTDVTHYVTDEFWRRFRRSVRVVNPTAYLIAEEWEDSTKYLIGDTFDSSMNYRFAWAVLGFLAFDKLTPSEIDDRLETYRRDTPPPSLLSQWTLIDSHDTGRALSYCQDNLNRFWQLVSFHLAYPGAPMIYYGDEVALTGSYAESGRKPFAWDNLNSDTTNFYRHALAIRRHSRALRFGSVETMVIDDEQRLYAFVRREGEETVYIAFNVSDNPTTITIPIRANENGQWYDALGLNGDVEVQDGALKFELPARGTAWMMCK